jgi:hypothetical protein
LACLEDGVAAARPEQAQAAWGWGRALHLRRQLWSDGGVF